MLLLYYYNQNKVLKSIFKTLVVTNIINSYQQGEDISKKTFNFDKILTMKIFNYN